MRILLVTGASGGHIFPALGFLEALKEKCASLEALVILPKRIELELPGYKVQYLENVSRPLGFLRAGLKSAALVVKFNPDIVVGFGGLASLPAVGWAWFLRITTLIHEQNVIPGKANRLLAHFADKIAVSFAETKNFLKASPKKIVLTGNPLRKEIFQVDKLKARDFFGLARDKFTILIMGGSQASARVNSGFLKAVKSFPANKSLQLIHLAGKKDAAFLEEEYKKSGITAKVFTFLREMRYAYSAADLAVCRGGAMSISELAFFKLPAIIIPYPYAGGHQAANAEVLKKSGAAQVIADCELGGDKLKIMLGSLITGEESLEKMRAGYDNLCLSSNANQLLADEVISLCAIT